MNADGSSRVALVQRMLDRLASHDKPGTVDAALTAVRDGDIEIPDLYDLLGDLLVGVGASWQAGTTAVWEEHLASGAVRTIVEALYPVVRARASQTPRSGRTVVLACPQDESHDLGLRMLSDRFDLAGWDTHLIGADTPSGEIAAAAEALSADLVVLSASTHFHRVRVRTLLDHLHSALPDVRVVVGGAAFTADCCDLDDEEVMRPEEFLGVDGAAPARAEG